MAPWWKTPEQAEAQRQAYLAACRCVLVLPKDEKVGQEVSAADAAFLRELGIAP